MSKNRDADIGSNLVTLKQAEKKVRMHWAADPHRPIMLWGASGIGKSALVESMVANPTRAVTSMLKDGQKPGFFIIRGHSLNPAELNGVLIDRGDFADWVPLKLLPDPSRGDPPAGYIFLDEVNAAMQSIMAELMQLVYDRRTANATIPDGYHIIAAGNRAEDRAAIHSMPSPLKRRFVNMHIRADLDEWARWAMQHDIDHRIIGFLRFRPELLLQDPARSEDSEACPRTWEYASGVLTSPEPCGDELLVSALSDCVGPGPGLELAGYVKIADALPDIDALLLGQNVPLPTGNDAPSVLYALCAGLITKLANPPKKLKLSQGDIAERIIKWSLRELSTRYEDYSVLLLRDGMAVAEDAIVNAKSYPHWADKHADVIL